MQPERKRVCFYTVDSVILHENGMCSIGFHTLPRELPSNISSVLNCNSLAIVTYLHAIKFGKVPHMKLGIYNSEHSFYEIVANIHRMLQHVAECIN